MKQRTSPRRGRQTTDRSAKSRARVSVLARCNAHAAGLAVGASDHWVAVPADRDAPPVRRLGTLTADLYASAQWREPCGIQTVGMASTGMYWMPLFEVLETQGFDVRLVDAQHVTHVPGRQTDVQECQWLHE